MRTALAFKTLPSSPYLGPGRVVQASENMALLELPNERTWALVALALPYRLAEGDIVLAIGQDDSWYVIGVLEGSGRTSVTVPGDLEICAPYGRIDIKSAKGISLQSPGVRIAATALEILSRTVLERFGRATRWVKEGFHLRAGRARTVVESDYRVSAGKIVERAQGPVKIDGLKIDLG